MRKGREVRKGELLMCSWIAILQQRLITGLCGSITRQGSGLVSVHESAACGVRTSGDKAVLTPECRSSRLYKVSADLTAVHGSQNFACMMLSNQ